jgi:RHS repeat-associated protein
VHLVAQDSVPTVVTINNRTGDLPYSSQIGSQFEHVELSSGNLIVTIPFLSLPGRGMSFDYGIRYDAAYWIIQNLNGGAPAYWNPEMRNWLTSTTLGWTSTQPYMTYSAGKMSCYTGTGGAQPKPQGGRTDGVMFTDEQGVKHQLLVNSQGNGDCTGGTYLFTNLQGPSVGEDGYWGSISNVTAPDGRKYASGGTSGGLSWPAAGTLNGAYFIDMAKVSDTRGNTQIVSPGNTDTVGRTPITQQTSANQIIYTVYDSNGNVQNYTVNLQSISISTHFGSTNPQTAEYSKTRTTVASVVLPNGQSYSFMYDSYGDITKITLPTGGYVSYFWSNGGAGSFRYVSSRTVNDGTTSSTWNIAITYLPNSANYTTTLTSPPDPQGVSHTTLYSYSKLDGDTPVLTSVVYDQAGNGSYPRGFAMSYYPSPPFYFNGTFGIYGPPLLKSITTTLDAGSGGPNGTVSKKEFDYDIFGFERYDTDCTTPAQESACEYWASSGSMPPPEFDSLSRGNVTAIREYGAAVGAPGPLLRQTIRRYLDDYTAGYGMAPNGLDPMKRVKYTGVNIVDKGIDETVFDGSSPCTGTGSIDPDTGAFTPPPSCNAVRIAERTLQYDNQVPATYGYHGEETASSRWLNTSNSFLNTTYVHDGFGNLTSITDPKSNPPTTIRYADSFASGVSTCSIASGSSTYPTSVTDALGHTRKLTYYGCTGRISADQDSNDIVAGRAGTTWTYDSMGRIATQTFKDLGKITNTYNDTFPDTVTSAKLITSSVTETNVVQNDGLGRKVKATLSSDPEGPVYATTSYDALGRSYQTTNPYRGTSDSTYGVTSTLYDGLSRPVSVTEPDNSTKTWLYARNAVTFTDEVSNQWTRTSDGLGRLIQVLEPNGSSVGPTMETDYSYDLLDNLSTVTQWGGPNGSPNARMRSFYSDSLSRLLAANSPESRNISGLATQTCTGAPAGTIWTSCYTYDADSNLRTKTDDRGVVITYAVDQGNRVYQKTYSNGDATVGYSYDAAGTSINGIGRRTGMTDSSGSTSWAFDPMGRTASENRTIAGINKQVQTAYHLDGSVWKITYPSTAVIEYTQSAAGRSLKVNDDTNNIAYAQNALYSAPGDLASLLVGARSGFSGMTISDQYNKRLQPLSIFASSPSGTLINLSYDFHLGSGDNGNVYAITDGKDASRNQAFQYDTLNRVKQATSGVTWGVAITYDGWGNLYQTNSVPGAGYNPMSVNQAMNVDNQFTLLGYAYDATGNVTNDGLSTGCSGYGYSWNAEELATCANGITYVYDGDGQRVKKSSGTLYWDGGQGGVLAESDLSGNLTSEYIFFNGKRLARRDLSGGSLYYYFSDHLGSSNVVTNASGAVPPLNESDFYPFGGERQITNSLSNQHYKFTGKERDSESGNDYFGARYYASSMGRFMSPDWSTNPQAVPYADFTHPQTLNRYQYMQNNPLSGADKDGHCDPLCGWLVEAVSTRVGTYLAQHPDVAKAVEKLGDSMGIKLSAGVGRSVNLGGVKLGAAASVSSEARADGTGSSKVQGTVAASVEGVGVQGNGTATFEKNGSFVNPLDNLGGNAKLTGSTPHGDNISNTNAAVGTDDRVGIGVGANVGIAQAGVQVTAGTQEVQGVASSVGNAAIQDTKQFATDLKESTTCTGSTCAIPH